MPALAEKTVDRASKLAPDVAEGASSGAELEAPTEDEDLMGNAASVDAMMDAEPDEPGEEDGGGILAAMMGAEEEAEGAEEPAASDPLAGMDLPAVGPGKVRGEDEYVAQVFDRHDVEVKHGVRVLFEGRLGAVMDVEVIDVDDAEYVITLEMDDGSMVSVSESDPFAVVDESTGSDTGDAAAAVVADGVDPSTGYLVGADQSASPSSAGGLGADAIAATGTILDIKRRTWTDDVYKERGIADAQTHLWHDHLKRKMLPKKMRAKLWSDAQEEFDGLQEDGVSVDDKAPKFRKMMVRAVERLDDYTLQVDTARAATEAHYQQVYFHYSEAESDGDTEGMDMYRDALATLKDNKDSLADNGPRIQDKADLTHERSQEVVAWADEVEVSGKSPGMAVMRGRDLAARADQYEDWVSTAFLDRVEGKRVANDAHAITRAIRDDAILGKRSKSYLKRKAKRARKDAKGVGKSAASRLEKAPVTLATWATGGMIDVEQREVDGGTATKTSVDFNSWKTNFDKVRAECALIEDDALYGSHTGLYTTLKMLADFGLPTLQGVLKALMFWGGILGAASLGAGLALSASAGTILLVVTGLKAALELVLALWSAKKVEDYTDRDARKKKHAKAERWKHGKAFAADAASTAAYGTLATKSSGKTMAADKALTERFEDFHNTDDRSDGSVSTAKGRKALGIPKDTRVGMDGVGHTTLDTPSSTGGARRGAHKLVDKTIDKTAAALGTGGRAADEERERRVEPLVDHSHIKDMTADDRFFSHESVAGPAPTSKAPAPPGAAGPAPEGPAPAPPSVDEEEAPDSAEARTQGGKVKRMASKVATGLAHVSEKVDEVAPKADDEEAEDKAAAVAQIAEGADVVAEALP